MANLSKIKLNGITYDLKDSELRNVISSLSAFVGNTDTNLGSYEIQSINDLTNMTPIQEVNDSGVIYTTTKTHLTAVGTASTLKLRTLQNNIICDPGDYEFSIGSLIQSAGLQIQLFNVTSNSVIYAFGSTSGIFSYQFSLSSQQTLRIRTLQLQNIQINESHEIYLHKVTSITGNHTLASAEQTIQNLYSTTASLVNTNNLNILNKNLFPIVTFIDDDTTTYSNVEKYITACESANVFGTLATITNKWENNTQLAGLLHDIEHMGHQVILHCHTQELNNFWSVNGYNYKDCMNDLLTGIHLMQSYGFTNWRYWATPNSRNNSDMIQLARMMGMECRFIGENWANDGTHPIDRYQIYRCALGANDSSGKTMAELKAIADECYLNNGWLVIMTHFAEDDNDSYTNRLIEFVTYCRNKGYFIMNVSEAWSYRKHYYDLNDMF